MNKPIIKEDIDLQQNIVDDMNKRKQAALVELNNFIEDWSKKFNVPISFPQQYVKPNS